MSEELQEVIISNPEWYRDLQYDDAKCFIKDNVSSAARSFIAIGYYLKYIRDNQMYTQDGYENIWDLAQAEFGISKSQASKFMSINDRFSKDGNSPVLLDTYKDFSSSKLSEMLYLTDEQLEQVKPVTTVAEIREIRKPEPEPEKVVSIPPKSKIEIDFTKSIDTLAAEFEASTAYACPPGQDDCRRNDWGPDGVYDRKKNGPSKACIGCWKDWLTAEKIKREVVSTSKQEPDEPYWKSNIIPMPQRDEYIEQLALYFLRINFDWFIEDHFNRVIQVEHSEKELKKKFTQPSNTWYVKMEDGEVYHFNLFDDIIQVYNGSSNHLGYIEWFYLCAAVQRKYNTVAYERSSWQPEVNDQPETVDNEPEIVNDVDENVIETSKSVIEEPELEERMRFDFWNHKPVVMKCSNCMYDIMSPDRYRAEHPGAKELPCNSCDDKLCNWEPITEVIDQTEDEPDLVETLEADIIQTVPEEESDEDEEDANQDPEAYTVFDIDTEMTSLMQWLEEFRKDNSKAPARRKSKMRWDAICLLGKQVREANIPKDPEPEPQRQPELPILKNNDQRSEWLKKYQEWGIWYQDDNINARYYKYDFPDGSRFVVVEYMHKQYVGSGEYEDTWGSGQYHMIGGKDKYSYCVHDFYNPYSDNTSVLIEHLKNIQKKGA